MVIILNKYSCISRYMVGRWFSLGCEFCVQKGAWLIVGWATKQSSASWKSNKRISNLMWACYKFLAFSVNLILNLRGLVFSVREKQWKSNASYINNINFIFDKNKFIWYVPFVKLSALSETVHVFWWISVWTIPKWRDRLKNGSQRLIV